MSIRNGVRSLVVAALFLGVDQGAKAVFRDYWGRTGEVVELVGGWLQLRLVWNDAVLFGLVNEGVWVVFLLGVAFGGVVWLFVRDIGLGRKWSRIGFGALIGGAMGNIVDRFVLGQVVDFIEVVGWSVFNLADVFIVFGVLVGVGLLLKNKG